VAAAPDIPTLTEAGLDGFELVAWVGVVAPAHLPQPIVEQLAAQIDRLTSDPATVERLTAMALEPVSGSTPDRFKTFVKAEVDRWGIIVRNSGAELE
jgi:tripartite-type tricarboxylate transporter receptor subunit TctC